MTEDHGARFPRFLKHLSLGALAGLLSGGVLIRLLDVTWPHAFYLSTLLAAIVFIILDLVTEARA